MKDVTIHVNSRDLAKGGADPSTFSAAARSYNHHRRIIVVSYEPLYRGASAKNPGNFAHV
jgi:hypothetical protein